MRNLPTEKGLETHHSQPSMVHQHLMMMNNWSNKGNQMADTVRSIVNFKYKHTKLGLSHQLPSSLWLPVRDKSLSPISATYRRETNPQLEIEPEQPSLQEMH